MRPTMMKFARGVGMLVLFGVLAARADDRQAEYIQLRLLIGEQRFDEASDRCKALIVRYPDYVYLYETLAEIGLYAQDLEGAAKFFEVRIEDGTGLEMSYFGLGTVYFNMAAYREAALCFDRAIELGNVAPECYRNFVYAYERLEGVDASIRFFNSLCHRDPKNAHLWYALALAYWSKRDYPIALKNLDEALSRNPAEQKYLQAKAAVLLLTGQPRAGISLLNSSMKSAIQRNDLAGIQFLASYEVLRQDREQATGLLNTLANQSLGDAKRFGQFRWIGWWYERLANIEYTEAMYDLAIAHARTAFEASRKCSDNRLALDAIIRQIESHMELGSYYEALLCAYHELEISQTEKDNGVIGRSLCDLAWIYHELGAEDVAMEYAIEALGMLENSKVSNELLMRVYATLGQIYEGVGNYQSALANLVASDRMIPEGNVWIPHRAVSHGNMGRVFLRIGDFKMAKYHFDRELVLARNAQFVREEVYSLNNLAELYRVTGRYQTAESLYRRAFEKSRDVRQKPTQLEAAIGLARIALKRGNPLEATRWYETGFAAAESMAVLWQENLLRAGNPGLGGVEALEFVSLLVKTGNIAKAFEYAEKPKLSTFRPNLSLGHLMQVAKSMSESERQYILELHRQLVETGFSLRVRHPSAMKTESRYDLSVLSRVAQLQVKIRKLLKQAEVQRSAAPDGIPSDNPSLVATMKWIPDSTTAIIEYCLGESTSLAFLVRKDSIDVIDLKIGRATVQGLIEGISNIFGSDPKFRDAWSPNLANFDLRACAEAYKKLLKPILQVGMGVKHLVIVPDGPLAGFPFECLVTSDITGSSFSEVDFLIADYEISYATSATSLIMPRHQGRGARRIALAVGNPEVAANPFFPSTSSVRTVELFKPFLGFPPLPGAMKEVAAIRNEFHDGVTVLTNNEATKGAIKSLLSDFSIVHIAAHASFDFDSPMRSSIFLAMNDEDDKSGILHASDFLDIHMNAKLVVLSSCNTLGSSSEKLGEGFVEALQQSGVPNIIASLWSADDNSSALLMTRFYHYLANGEKIVAALRKAKVDLIKSGKADPFCWAHFLLIGPGATVEFPPSHKLNQDSWLFPGASGLLVVISLAAFWMWRGRPKPLWKLYDVTR